MHTSRSGFSLLLKWLHLLMFSLKNVSPFLILTLISVELTRKMDGEV